MISISEVELAQQAWASDIIEVGKAYVAGEDYASMAETLVKTHYGYGQGPVLFKPTRASQAPFRDTVEGALSYFVAGNDAFPEDSGFALESWTTITFENHDVFQHDGIAMVMGHYLFSSELKKDVKVEYSMGYIKDEQQQLRLVLHHSSMPFQG